MPPASSLRLRIVFAFAAVYIIWGSTYLAIRFAIETIPPFVMAGSRFLVAGAALYAWTRVRGERPPTLLQWRSAAIIGALLLLVGNGGVTWAEQVVPSGITALLIGTVPLWFALQDWLWHGGTRPDGRMIAGLATGFVGVILLIGPGELLGGHSVNLAGVGVLMLSTIAWSGGSLYSRTAPLPASPLLATAMEMLCGGTLLMIAGVVAGEVPRVGITAISFRSLSSVLYLMLFGSIVAFSAYVWLLRVVDSARVATYAYVNPLIAVFLGWAFAGEELTLRMVLAAAVIICAVVVIVNRKRDRKPTSPALSPGRT